MQHITFQFAINMTDISLVPILREIMSKWRGVRCVNMIVVI